MVKQLNFVWVTAEMTALQLQNKYIEYIKKTMRQKEAVQPL